MRFVCRAVGVFIGFLGVMLVCSGVAAGDAWVMTIFGVMMLAGAVGAWVLGGRVGRASVRSEDFQPALRTRKRGRFYETEVLLVRLPDGCGDADEADQRDFEEILEHGGVLPRGRRLTEGEVEFICDALDDAEFICPFCGEDTPGPYADECWSCERSVERVRIPLRLLGGRFADDSPIGVG